MRKIFLLFVLFACSSKEKTELPPSPTVVDERAKRIMYEGVIKTKYGEGPVELSLVEPETGLIAPFDIRGDFVKDQIFTMVRGEYSTLQGAAGNEVVLQLHGTIMSTVGKPDPKKSTVAYKPEVHDLDLFFITDGGNKLILVDEDFNRIADDNRYTLYRRLRLFTVEGYVTFENTSTEFYEQNTNENWTVAPLGKYDNVQKIYDSLVTQKSEGMYLKALAYAIESDSSFNEPRKNYATYGVGSELLVIKKILEMKKSTAYTDTARAARLGYK
jgi:hypothetical protein